MEFVNHTEFPADLVRAHLFYRDLTMAIAVLKCSFSVRADGTVQPDDEQLAVFEGDVETSYGTVNGDIVPIKTGCDVSLLGPAVVPTRQHAESMDVSVKIGDFSSGLKVFGDRVWQRTASGFRASRPIPFTHMPLQYERSYGGFALHLDELGGELPENPGGRGFVVAEEHVEGTSLPNIEDPNALIHRWTDRPLPVGFAPLARRSSLRGLRGLTVDVEAQTTALHPEAFLSCHPKLHLPAYPTGGVVEVVGMTDTPGPWRFLLPDLRFDVQVDLGGAHYVLPMVTDTLCLLPRHNRLFVVARRAFVYEFKPERTRSTRIVATEREGITSPTTTIAAELTSENPRVPILSQEVDALPFPLDQLRALYPMTGIIDDLPLCAST